ncbi:pleckstrin homology domain-containing family M member 3 isoform X2 [Myxocyprinus asiaticus]|uniref:pleckstrin homology domain-containing family M member 3 isoform X2 n=1 Tax=Myxocyprinus asiaticus TaxID=70543 RepID=UPI00222291AC|nr:pleckstrin homology domain-containing family M member 3 isoform X2 [Myxocyprinus asiaticus]
MEGLEVEDISPALEATEDYLHCLDDNQGDGQVCPQKLKEASTLEKLNSSGVWGLLTGKQSEISPGNMAWAEQTSFNVLGLRNGKRNRARSTNDLAAHAKETNSTTTTSSSTFKRGHNRSRSDINNRSYTDNGMQAIDKNTLKNMALNEQRDAHKESSSSLVKQGLLEQREGPWGRWSTCHVELTPCELRLYSLDSSGNQQLCAALSLSHCQGVSAPQPQDGRVLQAVFFNSTRVQLRASCQWEALEWRRLLWERVLAARPSHRKWKPARATSPTPHEPDPDAASMPTSQPLVRPTALPLFTQHCADVLKAGLLHQLTDLNNWRAFTFVLSRTELQAFPTEGRGPVSEPVLRYRLASCLAVQRDEENGGLNARFQVVFPDYVLRLRAESEPKAQNWVEALHTAVTVQRPQLESDQSGPTGVLMRSKPARERRHREAQRAKRQSVTTSFLSILTCLAVEKGLTAQSFRCAEDHTNTQKTKELIVDYRQTRKGHTYTPIYIDGDEVEHATSFMFLVVHISEDLSWTYNTFTLIKKAQQRLYFLRKLRKAHLSPHILLNFYHCTIESILTNSITVWNGNCTISDQKALQRVVKTAQYITGVQLPSIKDIHHKRCLRRVRSIIKDTSHPNHGLFTPLPPG